MKKHNIFKGLMMSLLALVLVAGTFATGVKADATATYLPEDDAVKITAAGKTTVYYAVIKEDGTELTSSNFKSITKAAADTAVLKLGKDGLKIAENKEAKIVILDEAPSKDKTPYNATITIAPTTVKKVTVNINYAKTGTNVAFETDGIKLIDAEKNATNAAHNKVYYSTDGGVKWNCITGTTNNNTPFTGANLATLTSKKKATKVLFKVIGTAGSPNVRGTKAVSVNVKTQKELKDVKVDYLKDTIAIKNGYDYAVVETTVTDEAAVTAWTTVLPYNKNGSGAKENPNSTAYVAVKFDKNESSTAAAYTAEKANYKISTLTGNAAKNIFVRVSAGVGKPASKAVKIAIAAQAGAPTIAEVDEANDIIAESDSKGDLKLTGITKGTGSTTASPKFEYLIISKDTNLATSVANVDLTASKWTKIAVGGKINAEKAKSTVVSTDGSKNTITISADTYILVREQAVKRTKTVAGSPASAYTATKIVLVPASDARPAIPADADGNTTGAEIPAVPAVVEHYKWVPTT